jgi:hypothetical protein
MTVNRKTKLLAIATLLLLLVTLVPVAQAGGGCGDCGGCCEPCRSPGYWKNPRKAWPVDSIEIGDVEYTKKEAQYLMNQPVKGDKSITMFKALVAAELNVLNGCCTSCCAWGCIEDARWWLTKFPVGSGVRANTEAWQASHGEAIYLCLDAYNNGREPCADPCD